jgi:divalent metal cation (Fe/Co/Zn/Cd) transporter
MAKAIVGLIAGKHFDDNYIGIVWLGLTYFVMWALSWNKRRVGHALQSQVLVHVSDMNRTDAYLALTVVSGLLLSTFCDLYWADPVAALIIAGYFCEEGIAAWKASIEHARLGEIEYERAKSERQEMK